MRGVETQLKKKILKMVTKRKQYSMKSKLKNTLSMRNLFRNKLLKWNRFRLISSLKVRRLKITIKSQKLNRVQNLIKTKVQFTQNKRNLWNKNKGVLGQRKATVFKRSRKKAKNKILREKVRMSITMKNTMMRRALSKKILNLKKRINSDWNYKVYIWNN